MDSLEALDNLESSLREYANLQRSIASLEHFISYYNVESFEGLELDMSIQYVEDVVSRSNIELESFEESSTPASDAALGDAPKESKGEKLKKFANNAKEKMKEKLKELPEQIKKYMKILSDTLILGSKGLSNSAKQILDKLDNVDQISGKIKGNYSVFEEVRPQSAIDSLIKGVDSLAKEAGNAYNVILKKSDNASSNLTLYSYKGTEFKFDGTSKFFDSKLPKDNVDLNKLSKSDIKLVCEKIISLAEAMDNANDKIPNTVDLIKQIDDSKIAFALAGFYRTIIGGYFKYTIKISKMALKLANGSITKEVSKND